jgi:uncharacterized protein
VVFCATADRLRGHQIRRVFVKRSARCNRSSSLHLWDLRTLNIMKKTAKKISAVDPLALGENPTIGEIIDYRMSRRDLFRVGLVATAAAATPLLRPTKADAAVNTPNLPGLPGIARKPVESAGFTGIQAQAIADDVFRIPTGYESQVILRWGDPVVAGAPAFDLNNQSGEAQSKQVGFNHDYQHFFADDETNTRGVLWINHEYTSAAQMIPGYDANTTDLGKLKRWVDIELAAHGGTVAELALKGDKWEVLLEKRGRRITATTPMVMSGPAAQDDRLRGEVLGTLNNCAGGFTPWGTVLTCEENFNQYFANAGKVADAATRVTHTRYGVVAGASARAWEKIYDRFDAAKNPNEPFKYGWVVEIDPSDPTSTPVKRTALGRFKHEAATVVIANTGQVVVYSGDDERFDYFYKFVSYGKYDPAKGKANGALLDEGTLFVAKIWPDGTGEWLPLAHNHPRTRLNATNGFVNQADVLLRTRQAGDIAGATKMDRPEDVEANPATGKVYVTMTNNSNRRATTNDEGEVAANPRFDPRDGNRTGHIIELTAKNGDHASMQFTWEVFLLAGDPSKYKLATTVKEAASTVGTYYAGYSGAVSAIGSPDNVAFSPDGLLWIATDGAPNSIGYNDALHCVPVTGPNRGQAKQFLSVPAGAECCGPCFTADQRFLFVAVQHPGEDGVLTKAGDPNANPQSSWPDGPGKVPRPATVVIRHTGGKTIGS